MNSVNSDDLDPPLPDELLGRVPTLKIIPTLPDSNPNGDIFGGWLLSQMDIAGASRAFQYVRGRIVTRGVDAISFHKPVFLGDEVSFYTQISNVGTSSITIKIESWALRHTFGRHYEYIKVTEGSYTYVHIDENRKPSPIEKR